MARTHQPGHWYHATLQALMQFASLDVVNHQHPRGWQTKKAGEENTNKKTEAVMLQRSERRTPSSVQALKAKVYDYHIKTELCSILSTPLQCHTYQPGTHITLSSEILLSCTVTVQSLPNNLLLLPKNWLCNGMVSSIILLTSVFNCSVIN